MGSEISGNIRNVFVENCQMDSPNLDRAFRFKSNARRRGIVENVYVRNVEIGRVAEAVRFVNCIFRGVEATEVLQNVGSVSFKNITIGPAKKAPTRNSRSSWP